MPKIANYLRLKKLKMHNRLMHRSKLYRWVGGKWIAFKAAHSPAPEAKPKPALHIETMNWTICLWEGDGAYVATGVIMPGSNLELLRHFYCERIVGVKIWH